ncbi:MAG: ligase-associated DNA damage response DEXH box helicase [Planctomycetota bacterium]|nr:ligase-associated DNA damage response DEXH box helicase [Planctomycetota bacterium]
MSRLRSWMAASGLQPWPFQERTWRAYEQGRSGLVHVPTGSGKTWAAWFGPLAEMLEEAERRGRVDGLRVLHVSPLRAVGRDISQALEAPIVGLGAELEVGVRTGDSTAAERARQRKRLPPTLVTTPESLSLLIAQRDARERFRDLRCVIVDEWHELMASKRGVQVELALARLRRFAPGLRTWGLSATVRDAEDAARRLVGRDVEPIVVRDEIDRPVVVNSLLPDDADTLPWAGHLGIRMAPRLIDFLDPEIPTLVFTNTRSQAERWYDEILKARPAWMERMALHHGSIDRNVRTRVESGLKDGSITIAVCTSSLDLGVDFSPIRRVVQVGSPKGVARLIQRAGRSGHRHGESCEVVCVPTHALELVEIAAARQAIARDEIEVRPRFDGPVDCLVQHLVTVGLGGGFEADALFDEVRTAGAYESLDRTTFDWCVALAEHGGATLRRYDKYHRIVRGEDGRYTVPSRRLAAIHRLNIGTITGDGTISLKYRTGARIGTIEERFIATLQPGEAFLFAGKFLEFVRMGDMEAIVKPASKRTTLTPHWAGGRFPLSTSLSAAVRRSLDDARRGVLDEPEVAFAAPILEAQARISRIPKAGAILAEVMRSDEGDHLFLHPFEGRLVHEGLAVLLALRFGRIHRTSFGLSFNDHGIEFFAETGSEAADRLDFAGLVAAESETLFTVDGLVEDLLESVNLGELGKRQFRDVARVAGLVVQRYPGAESTARQLQAGAGLIYDVYREFDPGNLLLRQAQREVLDRQFEEARLARTLERLRTERIEIVEITRPGPLALPLLADRLGTTLSTESVLERLARMGVERPEGRVATEGLEGERSGGSVAARKRRGSGRGRRGPRRPRV